MPFARTGRDLGGRSLPLFFKLYDPAGDPQNQETKKRWYQPTLFYLTALVLEFRPLSARWRFYLTKHHREELLQRTRYFDGDGLDLGGVPPGTLIVLYADGRMRADLLATGQWAVAKTIIDNDNDEASLIMRKVK